MHIHDVAATSVCINYDGAAGDVDGAEDVDGGDDDDLKDVGDYAWHQYSL